jgi:mannosyltransferase OCH1-like enzyme
MPGWEMKLWDDRENANIMKRHFPEFSNRFGNIRRGVIKADIARCLYMYAFGGLYIDTDYKMLRPISDEMLNRECILPASRDADPESPDFRIGNAVLASEPGHEFWKSFLADLFLSSNLENLQEEFVEKVTGPEGLTGFYQRHREFRSRVYVPERRFFHPRITWKGLSYDRSFPSYGAHLCWGSWRSHALIPKIRTFAVRKLSSF